MVHYVIQTNLGRIRPLRIALIEPNGPDAHWFKIVTAEAQRPAAIFHYSTGVEALRTWRESGAPAIDVIVMSDVLPMLTQQEFVDGARTFYPSVPVMVVAEQIPVQPLVIAGVEFFTKPLTAADIRSLQTVVCGERTRIGQAA